MQNFTFGRKGTNWFLFTFVMLIGTLPSFGQVDCPSVVDEDSGENGNQQTFCYLSTVANLQGTPNGDGLEWYREADSTTPIPSTELLQTDTYWAGNDSGTCTSRESVDVTVNTIPAPVSEYGSVYSPYLESEDAIRTINDLTAAINTTSTSNEIVVYKTEYGTAVDEAYLESEELIAGQSYFVGQTSSDPCEYSFRIAIRYSPDVAPAPDAVSPQLFCAGATVADLEATGTSEDTQAFRWYSTSTSNPALEEDEELISGTYYVSQIVNDEGFPFPPVESEDRTPVEVTIDNFDAGEDVSESYCYSEITDRIEDGESTDDIFLSDASFNEMMRESAFLLLLWESYHVTYCAY